MATKSIRLPRPALLTSDQLQQIHEAAVRILSEIGLRVRSPEALEAARRGGLRVKDDRTYPDRTAIEEFISHTRAQSAQEGPVEAEPAPEIRLGICQYAHHLHDTETDELLPASAERLIEAAKFTDTLASRGVMGKSPGLPVDVPPDLQCIVQYRIGALYCRHGRGPVEVRSVRALPYIMEMAEVLGHPMRSQAIYVVSPLTLGGDSFEIARAGRKQLESVWVSDMMSVGATGPIRMADALALAAAEVIGGAIVAREVTGLRVEWSIRICPFDLRAMALSLGSPEELILQWAFEEVNAFYHGRPAGPPNGSLHSQAKVPDAQSSAERMTIMLTAALFGTRVFVGGGRLSLDEVFSPEQLVIDCEMRDHVQALIAGIDGDCDPGAAVAEVAAGLKDGFLGLDSTVRSYRSVYWRPHLFERRTLGEWLAAGSPDFRRSAREMVRELGRRHDYELEPDLRGELDRIYTRAEKELAN